MLKSVLMKKIWLCHTKRSSPYIFVAHACSVFAFVLKVGVIKKKKNYVLITFLHLLFM